MTKFGISECESTTVEQCGEGKSCIVRPRKLPFNLSRRLGRNKKPNVPPSTVDAKKESSGPQTTNMIADAENLPAAEPALPSRSKLRLAEVDIQSDMLLHHPFSQWTLLTLNAASSTITKLSLKLTSEASSTWKIFSATLFLPLLRTISFTNDLFIPLDVALFTDLEDFLVNHPRIKNLTLYGVGFPPPLLFLAQASNIFTPLTRIRFISSGL